MIAGSPDDVLKAFQFIIEKAKEIGLTLNSRKCEMSILGPQSSEEKKYLWDNTSPGIQEIEPSKAFLLGCPLTEQAAVACLDQKTNDLKKLTNNLKNMSARR